MICGTCAIAADTFGVKASHVDCEGHCDCRHRRRKDAPIQCAECNRTIKTYANGTVVVHKDYFGHRCSGSKREPLK
jgi:hypothetical protein